MSQQTPNSTREYYAELERAQITQDAKRYRWLRENLHSESMQLPPMIYMNGGDGKAYDEPHTFSIDAAIDAALAKAQP